MNNFWPDVVAPSCQSIIRSTIEWLSVSNTKTSPIMPLCIMHYALCINAFHQQLTIVVNAFLPNHQVYGLWLEKRQLSNHWPKYHLDMSPIPQKGQLNAFFRVFDVVAERPLHEWVTFGQMSSRYEPIYSKPLWAAQTVWVRTRLGWTRRGSQLCKSSFSYSTRGDLRSISGWGTRALEDHPITQLTGMMIHPMKFSDTDG